MYIKKINISVIGIGYVGLPLSVALSKKFKVNAYDINTKRIKDLQDQIHQNFIDHLKKNRSKKIKSADKDIYNGIKDIYNDNDKINIIHKDYLDFPHDKKYDLIIGNPPYFVMKKKQVNKAYHKYFIGRPNIFIIFII